jgi:hypothetical protein
VVDWLFSYSRFIDHESYKYLMRKLMMTLTLGSNGENAWITTAQHKSPVCYKMLNFLKIYVNSSAIAKGQFN